MLFEIVLVFEIFSLLIVYFILPNDFSRINLIACIVVAIINIIFVFSFYKSFLIRPSTLVLFGILIVNFQCFIDLALGLIDENSNVFMNSNVINKGVLLSTIAVTMLTLGYYNTNGIIQTKTKQKKHTTQNNNKQIMNFFIVVQIVCFINWLVHLTADDFSGLSYIGSGSYNVSKKEYNDVLFITSQITLLTYFVKSYSGANKVKDFFLNIPKIVVATSLIYVIIKLMSGDRGGAIYTLLLYFSTFIIVIKRSPRLIFVVPLVLLGALVMTSIRFGRLQGDQISFKEKATYVIVNADEIELTESFSPLTRELAGSLGCQQVVLDQFENKGGQTNKGLAHFCYVIQTLPFIGNAITIKLLNIPSVRRSSSEYITITHSGRFYSAGMGTSLVADEYFDFGLLGVLVAFLLFGILLKKADCYFININANDIPVWVLLAILTVCCYSISIPRGYFLYYFKYYFYSIVYYALVKNVLFK